MNLKPLKSVLIVVFVSIAPMLFAQRTQQDTMIVFRTLEPVIIDGKADDACWVDAEWFPIDQVWIPYNENMKEGDFEGRFKLAWDSLYLYLLAEIVDDSLSDYYSNPLQNWWEDDCLEIFIDEDCSKGDHECNYNAFAYHVSIFYDALDMAKNCGGINLKNNLIVKMDTIGENKYVWEVAIKNYSAAFNPANPEASRVYLHHNKRMGFSLAYCDNDGGRNRENFIGSIYLPQARANDSYKTADLFGTLLLVDPVVQNPARLISEKSAELKLFPNPANDWLRIEYKGNASSHARIEIADLSGRTISDFSLCEGNEIDISALNQGAYVLRIFDGIRVVSGNFVKQ